MHNKELEAENALYADIEVTLRRVKKSKRKYVVLHRSIRILILVAGGVITVLTGWKLRDGAQIDVNIVLVISTIITVAAAIENLFDMRDKAMGYNVILFELRKLKDDMGYEYLKNKEISEDKHNVFYERYQVILSSQKTIMENAYKNGD